MSWVEVEGIQKEIILCVKRKEKSISEIALELNKTQPNVSQAVSRMESEGIVFRDTDFLSDSRKAKVSLVEKNINIKRTHFFYYISFLMSIALIFASLLISFLMISPEFFMGTLLGILPLFFFMLYQAYIKEDKILVEKNVKNKKKTLKKSELTQVKSELTDIMETTL